MRPGPRPLAGGELIAVGALLPLHLVGIMIQVARWEGADALRLSGRLGVVGGLLLVVAGISVLRAERPAERVPLAAAAPSAKLAP